MAVDYFLKIDGIPGESSDSKHKGEIDVEAWSWGETHPVLSARRQDKSQAEFLTFSLSDVLVSSYQTGGAEGGQVAPVDSVSLNFSKIQIEYKEQKADGSLGGSTTVGWDAKQNKQF